MSDHVGNPEDWFSHNEAHKKTCLVHLNLVKGYHLRMVLAVKFYIFLKLNFFALLLL